MGCHIEVRLFGCAINLLARMYKARDVDIRTQYYFRIG